MALVRLTESALDIWWALSSVLGSGIIGLFLLGLICRRATNRVGMFAVTVGSLVIIWMVLSKSTMWPESLMSIRSPFHDVLVIVVGAVSIVGIGSILPAIPIRQKNEDP